MLAIPDNARFGRVIPKKKFYEHADVNAAMRRRFVDLVDQIRWLYKIAPTTVNISAGKTIPEIEVFDITLKEEEMDEKLLTVMDRAIPYPILYLLRKWDRVQAWMAYKKLGIGGLTKVDRYFHTPWMKEEALPLTLEGLTTDQVYEHFLRQLAGGAVAEEKEAGLDTALEREDRRRALQKEIAKLTKKMKKEKQFNRQVELRDELLALKQELEAL